MNPLFSLFVVFGIFEVLILFFAFRSISRFTDVNLLRLWIEKWRGEMIAGSISDGVFLLHGETILYLNPIAERILTVNREEALSAVSRAIKQTLPIEYMVYLEGKKFYYLFRSCPISCNPTDALVLAQDVTLVKESQEAKTHFLASLSHEIKTPVTSLTMATRMLKNKVEEFSNPVHKSLILTSSECVDRLRVLLEDLLTVSRLDIFDHKLEIQKIDFGKFLRHTVQSFSKQAEERGIKLSQQVIAKDKPLVVPMDASKIAWALSNLVINALRHTPRGGEVAVSVEATFDWIEVSVIDTGPGIDKQRQERMFDKFNPYYNLRIARSGSVGAGLAIAKEIVTAHGGKIWVESEPSHGAKFSFILPLRKAEFMGEGLVEVEMAKRNDSVQTKNSFIH